jgi:hypothetical protein
MYKNTIRSVYVVVIVFFICHLPYRVVGIWLVFENTTRINIGLLNVTLYPDSAYFDRCTVNKATVFILSKSNYRRIRVVGIWLVFENTTRIVDLGLEMYLILMYASRLVFYINHSLNPILYSFVSSNVRKSVYTNLRLVCHMLPFSPDCPFLKAPSVFSKVYFIIQFVHATLYS